MGAAPEFLYINLGIEECSVVSGLSPPSSSFSLQFMDKNLHTRGESKFACPVLPPIDSPFLQVAAYLRKTLEKRSREGEDVPDDTVVPCHSVSPRGAFLSSPMPPPRNLCICITVICLLVLVVLYQANNSGKNTDRLKFAGNIFQQNALYTSWRYCVITTLKSVRRNHSNVSIVIYSSP